MIYLDNAASTWPKPGRVIEAMTDVISHYAANPGRGTHRLARQASESINQTRIALAALLGIRQPVRLSFFMNATQALNQAIKGFLKTGDHVITSRFEHNSVLRPLAWLETKGVTVTYLGDRFGRIEIEDLERSIQSDTKLVILTHASNVLGSILPVTEISGVLKRHGIPILIDASQTIGTVPIDVEEMGIDMLAFPGHKGLFGPQGTGALYVREGIELEPFIHGGTGGRSEIRTQPSEYPERLESGTPNTVGLAGLGAGISFIREIGIDQIREKEKGLIRQLWDGLQAIPGVQLLGTENIADRAGLLSFKLPGISSQELATLLDQYYQICVRGGLHCAPDAHRFFGEDWLDGAVRASVSWFNKRSDIDALINAVKEIADVFVK
jgi:cysteine desulfurase family protein